MKKCPFCAEDIQDAAIVCRYCNRELTTSFTITLADEVIEDANKDQLSRAVDSLVSAASELLIVSKSDLTYIQAIPWQNFLLSNKFETATGDSRLGFVLEYQNGSTDKHYRASVPIQSTQLFEVFSAYIDGLSTWKVMLTWSKVDLSQEQH